MNARCGTLLCAIAFFFLCVLTPTFGMPSLAHETETLAEGVDALTSSQEPGADDVTNPTSVAKPPEAQRQSESPAPSHNAPTPASPAHNAARAAVESAGVFTPAETAPRKRPAFGVDAGTAVTLDAVSLEPEHSSRAGSTILMWATAACGACTIAASLMLARRMRKDGTRILAFTLGSKLSLATGGLATLLLACSANAIKAQADIADANYASINATKKQDLVASLDSAVLKVRLAHRGFRLEPTDGRLVEFSNAAHEVNALVEQAIAVSNNEKTTRLLAGVKADCDEYNRLVAEVVRYTDESDGFVQGSMVAAAIRASLLINTVSEDLRLAGSLASVEEQARYFELSLRAKEIADGYQQARLMFYQFVAFRNQAHAKQAGELALGVLSDVKTLTESAARNSKPMLTEAMGAVEFWQKGLDRCVDLAAKREATIKQNTAAGLRVIEGCKAVSQAYQEEQLGQASIAERVQAMSRMTALALSGVALTIAAGVAFWLTSTLMRASARVLSSLRAVADGDLTRGPLNETRSDELGEIARAADEMAKNLKDVINEVSAGSRDVSAAATEIAASSEQMSAAVGEVARQATQAAQSADSSGRIAASGGDVVQITVARMKEIATSVSESAANVTILGKKGDEIGTVIAVINDIADQTNLLALNAAIEAARAGEHGRGFAVVADEVRKLADRTARATEEIGGSIKDIQNVTGQAVTRMQRGTEQVRTGVESAEQAGASLEQIVAGARDVAAMITSISAASEEAGAGSTQSAAAAGQLSQKAEQLRIMVSRFKV